MSQPQVERLDQQHEAQIRESFRRQAFMNYLGAEMAEICMGSCEVRVPYRPELSQQHGYFHAGVSGAVADTACGYAAFSALPKDSSDVSLLTVEYKLNLLAPARGEMLIIRAQLIRAGRTLKTCRADVFCVRDGRETHCATSLATIMAVAGRAA
jgi:uncharacterized protein (TIGR00369 family)